MTRPEDKQRVLNRLLMQTREGSNAEALKVMDTLREYGWLTDGSLFYADLCGANLSKADLYKASLLGANLEDAILSEANLSEVNLNEAVLCKADLHQALLSEASLRRSDLREACLIGVVLTKSDLSETFLQKADLTHAICAGTVFSDVDLSAVNGLETVRHHGPSNIDVTTLYRSKGKIPEIFLRGCGVPQEFIEFTRGLFGGKAIQFHNCFISYSHKDGTFARKLHQELYDQGVNPYIDFEGLKGGDFWADVINQAIHHHEKLLVCCSENSLHSLGVDREVNTALRIEERIYAQSNEKVSIIIPVDMDGYIWHCENHVAHRLQERHIINAKNWRNDFAAVLADILKALRTDEGREDPPEPKL